MEFRDLHKQYNRLKNEIDDSIKKVLKSGNFILGEPVIELERKLSSYVGRKHCVSCANGTDALVLALKVFNIGPGSAVFTPNFTYIASASCVSLVGATPVFVDIDLKTYNISIEALENQIIKVIDEGVLKPKAIIAVDLFGQPANYQELSLIADKYGLIIVEDAAQGFGGSIDSKKACSFGDISCTSFFPAKPLGCYGDGGAVFVDDDLLAKRLISLRSGGKSPSDKYDNLEVGYNSRLDTIQAAVLLIKYNAFIGYELDMVNRVADRYNKLLKGKVQIPTILDLYISSWAQYTILLKNEEQRNRLKKTLEQFQIPSMVYYPKGMHQQLAFSHLNIDPFDYPNTIEATKRCLSLPMHPYLEDEEIDFICSVIIRELENNDI